MPYRRRKRYFRKRKRYFKGYFKRKQLKYSQRKITFAKLKGTVTFSSNGAGLIQQTFFDTDPALFDTANPLQDWLTYAALYDQYRVCAIKFQWIPTLPNNESATAVFQPFYTIYDQDSAPAATTTNALIQYSNLRVKNLYKPWKVYYKVARSFSSQVSNVVVGSLGWYDTDVPSAVGRILFSTGSEACSASVQYGRMICTYYIAFKNQR